MDTQAVSRKPILRFLTWCALYLLSFCAFATLWHWLIEDVLYYCSDNAPVLDFFPPFVHEPLEMTGDYYIISPIIVYAVWSVFLIGVLLLPTLALQLRKRWLQVAILGGGLAALLAIIGEVVL